MAKRRPKNSPSGAPVRVDGREYPVLDRLRIRGRTYLILESLGNLGRQRYMAFDTSARELRAILVLPRTRAAAQHVRTLSRLKYDNVPRIFDHVTNDEQLTIVIDWIRGPTLQEHLDAVRSGDRPHPSPTEAFRLFRGLAHGLGHMHHHRQTIHGDITPRNLIVSGSRLMPIDFGSAWFAEHAARRDPGDGNHPAYAAPELGMKNVLNDIRADQFSASVVFYELLTLQIPYDHLGGKAGRPDYIDEFRNRLVLPSKATKYRRRVPRALWQAMDRIVATGLSLDPEERYATRDAWLDAIEATQVLVKRAEHESPLSRIETALTRFVGRITSRRRP